MGADQVVTLFKYKQWIDAETLQAIKRVDTSVYAHKHHLMLRLMNHIYVVDMIFTVTQRLIRQRHRLLMNFCQR